MKKLSKNMKRNAESGVALLIAMIALLLISGVAVAMIVASGSEGALNGNYRSSSSAYYAALAGIEEGRGRMLATSPTTIAGVGAIPASLTAPMLITSVQYIVNPNTAAGETTGTVMATYPDNEYVQEFGVAPVAAFPAIASTSSQNAANMQGPMYKWVRINPVSEKSMGNVDVNGDGIIDALTPLYYDSGSTPPTMVVPVNALGVPSPSASQNQVFEVTALAVLPNGSEKLLQYLVAPQTYNFSFNSPLTLAGSVGAFAGATSNPYQVNGNDGSGNPPAVAGCTPNTGAKDAISVSAGTDQTVVQNGIPNNRRGNYTGLNSSPDVAVNPMGGSFGSTASLDQLLTNVKANADAVLQPYPPPAATFNNDGTVYNFGQSGTGYTWPTDMSPTNPKTIYVDGSFDLGPNTGYGLLVVTGNFRYQGNSGWKGIILVVGDGTTTFLGNGGGNGSFDGAIYVATTRDANGNQLANFGTVNFDITGGGGNGIYYNSCWIKQANQPPTYKVLSFKEIQYTD
jgi:Tfp pilus assembly protein PilX